MILCDTWPLVAAFNAADGDHARCTAFLRDNWSRLVVPSLAVTEICHLLADPQRRGRTELAAEFCAVLSPRHGWRPAEPLHFAGVTSGPLCGGSRAAPPQPRPAQEVPACPDD
jgi:predicted nucleic acid-binding protein